MIRRFPILFAAALACGGASPQTATVAPLPSGTTTQTPAPRDVIGRMWPIAEPRFLLRANVSGLLATPLAGSVVPAAVKNILAEIQTVPPEQAKCIDDALGATQEVVSGGSPEGDLTIVLYDPAKIASPRACFGNAEAADVDGALEAWKADGSIAAIASRGVLGTRSLVERALHSEGASAGALAKVTLGRNQYVRATFRNDSGRGDAALVLSDSLFALRGDGDVPEELAHDVVAAVEQQRSSFSSTPKPPGIDTQAIERTLRAVSVTGDGRHVHFAFELHEPVKQQAYDLGVAAALAIYGVHKYLLESKESEARANVHAISRALAAWWEEEQAPPKPRHRTKLVSFSPVPKDVPRGTKYASTEADWRAWAPLRFEIDSPQRYQYEVRAAKDGMSAEIIARGDLNGDGKTSLFKLSVKVRRSDHALDISPDLVTVDPDE